MDIAFKQSGEQLKVNDTIMGAKITPEQKKMLQNHEMVFIENMRYKGRVFPMMYVSATRVTNC